MNGKAGDIVMFLIVGFLGLAVWLAFSAGLGYAEAWDAPAFFSRGLPMLMAISLVAGFVRPGLVRSFSWGFAVIAFQPVALAVMSRVGPLFLVGVFIFIVFGVLCSVSGLAGSGLRLLLRSVFLSSASSR